MRGGRVEAYNDRMKSIFSRSSASWQRLAPAAPQAQDEPVDVTGTWAFDVAPAGTGTPTVTFKQDGEKLTGTYFSERFGEQALTGTIKGNEITFSFRATSRGTPSR